MLPQRLGYQGIPDIIGGEHIDRYGSAESIVAAANAYVGEQTIMDSNPIERYTLQIIRENCLTARHWLGQKIPRQDAVIIGQVRSSHDQRDVRFMRAAEKADEMRERLCGVKADKAERAKWRKQLRSEWW